MSVQRHQCQRWPSSCCGSHCDITIVTLWCVSPSMNGAHNGDLTPPPALLPAPAEPGPAWLVPALRARARGLSEASSGAGWWFGSCLRQQLSVRVPEPSPAVSPWPSPVQAARHCGTRWQQRTVPPGRPRGGQRDSRSWEGVLLEGNVFLSSLPSPGQQVTVASFHFVVCDPCPLVLKTKEQLFVLVH